MKMTSYDENYIRTCLDGIMNSEEAEQMKEFIQHGNITTYSHVLSVACMSYMINKRLKICSDPRSLVIGAFLHDYYLYDWHVSPKSHKLHGFNHPVLALKNARKSYALNPIEENIIISHMWPLTLTRVPRCSEAVIVCISDKICAIYEFLRKNRSVYYISD